MPATRFPIWAIVLDVFGTLIAAAGIFLVVSEGEMMGMASDDLTGLGIGLIVVGVMLMVPLVVSAIRIGIARGQASK